MRRPHHQNDETDPSTRLNAALEGRYRIEGELGEGGMAIVYLANDLRHQRKVALKVLKPELAAVIGAERFLAEIKTTAALQHPHILPLFDSGEADGFLFYVMPYVEGESLSERLDREHQLPVDVAVHIASAVAAALDYAHRHDVIHRDIKPANILLHDNEPVVTDFGIALALNTAGGDRLTETGLSLGTPHYMSPEQATGDRVGPTTDVHALGCVLYEMLVGEPPFGGSTPQAVLGNIIAGGPVSAKRHRESVLPNVDAAIRRALEKVPADRFSSAQEMAEALADPAFRHGGEPLAGAAAAAGPWRAVSAGLGVLAAVSIGALAWALARPESAGPVERFALSFEPGQAPSQFYSYPELTAAGSAVVYSAPSASGQGYQLWLRRWADLAARPLRGTERPGPIKPALSPDGREVAFSGQVGPVQVVGFEGGPTRTLYEGPVAQVLAWSPDGWVYFSAPGGIYRVSAVGGGTEAVESITQTASGETAHAYFALLPGGRLGVFQVWRQLTGEDAELWAVDLETGERNRITAGAAPVYTANGYLLFVTFEGELMAVTMDPETAELTGVPVPVAEGLAIDPTLGTAAYAVSETGTLFYSARGPGSTETGLTEPVWTNRSGEAVRVDPDWTFSPPPANELGFGGWLSPDGERVAVASWVDGNLDVWIKNLPSGPFERLTVDDADETFPYWSPDGQSVTYLRAEPGGNYDAWRTRADGSGAPELLLDDDRSLAQVRWSRDGEWMIFRTGRPTGATGDWDIRGFRPGVDSVALPLVASPDFAEFDPALSPDRRWLAYTSDLSGRNEVYVSAFPEVGLGRVRVSSEGGWAPRWAHSGRELFFIDATEALVAAEIEADAEFRVLQRETLFALPAETRFDRDVGYDPYDVAPDDDRFLFWRFPYDALSVASTDGAANGFVLVQNWFQELGERMAVN